MRQQDVVLSYSADTEQKNSFTFWWRTIHQQRSIATEAYSGIVLSATCPIHGRHDLAKQEGELPWHDLAASQLEP
jgi:hypothetical protein